MAVERHLRALEAAVDGPLALSELVHRLHHSGFALLVIFLSLPFLQPLPLGGLSSVLGPLVALLGMRLALGRKELVLPGWIGNRRLETRTIHLLLKAARTFFSVADKIARPRLKSLASNERAAGAGIALSGSLLTLPFPIPLSNILCAAPATLLALGLLEEDGALALLGWTGLFLALAFHVGLALLGASGVRALWSALLG